MTINCTSPYFYSECQINLRPRPLIISLSLSLSSILLHPLFAPLFPIMDLVPVPGAAAQGKGKNPELKNKIDCRPPARPRRHLRPRAVL